MQYDQFDPHEPKYWELSSPTVPGPRQSAAPRTGAAFTTRLLPGIVTVTPADRLARLRVALYRGDGRCVSRTHSTGAATLPVPRTTAPGLCLLHVVTRDGAQVLKLPDGEYHP